MNDWTKKAACRGLPIHLFYNENGTYRIARTVCESCHVIEPCRAENDANEPDTGMIHGFRAGEGPEQRRERRRIQIKNGHRRPRCVSV